MTWLQEERLISVSEICSVLLSTLAHCHNMKEPFQIVPIGVQAGFEATFRVRSWSLTGTTWAKQTHIFLCHDPPTKRVWEERKHRLIQLFAALHSQKSLLIMLPCLCRWLYLPAKADCLVRILKQSLQVTSYPCGQKPSLLIMRDEMTQYCQNKKSWGIIDCHQGLIIFLDVVCE